MKAHKTTRIQAESRRRITKAAVAVFACEGFRAATVEAIAAAAGMSKQNLLYYFASKDAIYRDVLEGILHLWLAPLRDMDPNGDPTHQIAAYIDRKIELARDQSEESRLFAYEMLRGAPILRDLLEAELAPLVEEKASVIRHWMAAGRLRRVDPYHLIFAIWSSTQHYADFDEQIRAIVGPGEGRFHDASASLKTLMLRGLTPD